MTSVFKKTCILLSLIYSSDKYFFCFVYCNPQGGLLTDVYVPNSSIVPWVCLVTSYDHVGFLTKPGKRHYWEGLKKQVTLLSVTFGLS